MGGVGSAGEGTLARNYNVSPGVNFLLLKTKVKRKTNPNRTTLGSVTNSDEKALLDYMHGHVTDPAGQSVEGQQNDACFYEYARMCPVLCKLAIEFQKRGFKPDRAAEEKIIKTTLGRLDETVLYYQWLWLGSQSYFPHLSWRDVPLTERPRVADKAAPLPTLRMVECAHYGEKAKEANELAHKDYERRTRGILSAEEMVSINEKYGAPTAVWRLEEKHEIIAMFRLDTRLSKSRLVESFQAWLELPEISVHLQQGKTLENRMVAGAADRLKDLAIWKLYRQQDNNYAAVRDFLVENQKRDSRGNRIPFLDGRRGRGIAGRRAVDAMANRPQSYFLDAVSRAEKYRNAIFVFEGWQEREREWEKRVADPASPVYRQYPSHLK